MPRSDELPETMKPLARRNAARVTNERFHSDAQGLITALEQALKNAVQYYSCFIASSAHDREFADRLYADLQKKGVRCWFAPYHLSPGHNVLHNIYTAIQLQDKMLLILSKHSINSDWVEKEVALGMEEERNRDQLMLVPIRIDDAVYRQRPAWVAVIFGTRFIGDFTRWKDQAAYKTSFERLVRDLIKPKLPSSTFPMTNPEKRAEEQERDQQRPQNRRSFGFDPGGPFEPPWKTDDEKLYVNAGEAPAFLRYDDQSVQCVTLGEAAIEWHRLSKQHQELATIEAGRVVYSANDIRRFHYGPKPA
jgi:hypothetical protein